MIFAGIDVDIITHEKALNSGIAGFGLWAWGMCYAQKHTTDGRLPLVAVMSALDEDRRILRRAAVRLVTSGLWVESADGSFAVFNYPKKNQTADDIQRKKDAATGRKERWLERQEAASRTRSKTLPEREGTPSPPEPPPPLQPSPPEREGDALPEWVGTSIDSVSATTGEMFDRAIVWTKYQGSREDSGRKPSPADFRGFLASWASRQKSERVNRQRGAETTKQPYEADAPWLKLPEVG